MHLSVPREFYHARSKQKSIRFKLSKKKEFNAATQYYRSAREGVQHMTRLSGVGAMKPNTVVVGFPRTRSADVAEADDFKEGEYACEDLDSKFPGSARQDDPPPYKRTEGEFIAMIGDVLKMRRSLCVHRNFQVVFRVPLNFDQKGLVLIYDSRKSSKMR